jgi:hypothetical protein
MNSDDRDAVSLRAELEIAPIGLGEVTEDKI